MLDLDAILNRAYLEFDWCASRPPVPSKLSQILMGDIPAMTAEIRELRGLCSETLAWLMSYEEADDLFDRICLAIFGLSEKEKENDARP